MYEIYLSHLGTCGCTFEPPPYYGAETKKRPLEIPSWGANQENHFDIKQIRPVSENRPDCQGKYERAYSLTGLCHAISAQYPERAHTQRQEQQRAGDDRRGFGHWRHAGNLHHEIIVI